MQDDANASVALPPPKPMRAGPPSFSTVESELVGYADRFGRMTALQEQEARANGDGPIEDFGRTLIGKSYQFCGRVENVERFKDKIVVYLAYQPLGWSGRVAEPGEGLQRVFYSREEWRKRRAWRLSISLPNDAGTLQKANRWSIGAWLSIAGRVEQTHGFTLRREGTMAQFTSNQQLVEATSTGPLDELALGDDGLVVIVLDRSGSMSDEFRTAKLIAKSALRMQDPSTKFAIFLMDDSAQPASLGPIEATRENLEVATRFLDECYPEGQTDIVALTRALALRPDHVICITDGDFEGRQEALVTLLGGHQDTDVTFVLTPMATSNSWLVGSVGTERIVTIDPDRAGSRLRPLTAPEPRVQRMIEGLEAGMREIELERWQEVTGAATSEIQESLSSVLHYCIEDPTIRYPKDRADVRANGPHAGAYDSWSFGLRRQWLMHSS